MAVSEGVKTVPGACLSSDLDTQTDQTPSDSSDIKLRDVSFQSYFKKDTSPHGLGLGTAVLKYSFIY